VSREVGRTGAIVPLEVSGERSAALVQGSRLTVVEGALHGVNASHPAQFTDALIAFLGS